jgi:hypothetical protein
MKKNKTANLLDRILAGSVISEALFLIAIFFLQKRSFIV